jgi:hypothetical protein
MNKFKASIFLLGIAPSFATNINLGYGQTSFFCPKSVICDSENPTSCHLSENPYDLWDKPNLNNSKTTIKGSYYLSAVISANSKDDEKNINKAVSCSYVNGQWDTYRVFTVTLKNSDMVYFKKQKKPTSRWDDNGFCFPPSDDSRRIPLEPTSCPMVQSPGISIYDESPINLFYPNPNAYFEANFVAGKWMSYDQLYKRCGATSNCIIDIGICDSENENCTSYGSVELDISSPNIVKLNQIHSYKVSGNPYVFVQKQPFNIIQSTK